MDSIAGYAITDHLATSASSRVYRARRLTDGAAVILKVLRDDGRSPEHIGALLHEYQVLRSLNLAGVPQVYGLETGGRWEATADDPQQSVSPAWILIVADAGGESLPRLGLVGSLSLFDFLHLGSTITAILGQLHQQNILHTHICPSHIVFNPTTGQVQMIDFGRAVVRSSAKPGYWLPQVPDDSWPYLAPEHIRALQRTLDERTDLYALGVTLYELLTGQLPFVRKAGAEATAQDATRPLPPHYHKRGIPETISAIILKLLAHTADERYQSADGLQPDLATCLQQLRTQGYIEPFPLGQQDVAPPPRQATGQPAADTALRQDPVVFAAFLEHAPAAIFVKDTQGQFLLANKRTAAVHHRTPEQMVGTSTADLFPAPIVTELQSHEQQVLAMGQPVEQEQAIPHDDGMHTYLITRFPLYNAQGAIYALGGFATDITERKRTEAALRLAQVALDRSADSIIWIAADARLLYVNDTTCEVLGYSRDELLRMTLADINPVFPMDTWEAHWNKLKQQGAATLETAHQRKDGSIFAVEVRTRYLEWADNAYLCSFVRDITERKQTEHALRKWADIFHRIKIGVVVSDEGSQTLDMMNPALARMYGYTVEEMTGKPIAEVYAPDSQPEYAQSARRVQEQDHVVFEAQHIRKDGTTFPVLVDVTSVRHRSELGAYRIANVQDLTERKRAETQLLQQHQALSMLRERERLARELHDNLGQVLGYVKTQAQAVRELLRRGEVALADTYLANLIAAAQDSHIDIREFILGATVSATPEQGFFTRLGYYLQRFEQLYALKTNLDVPPDLGEDSLASTTQAQLLRIIQEALTNARKHADAQTVTVRFARAGDQVRVVVADDGHGFDGGQVAVTGTAGYGLRSMRERAAEIGAQLQIHSTLGRGTQVVVQLPSQAAPAPAAPPMRVLLVDDHPLFLQGMQNLLRGRGITIVGTAHDGLEAIAQARQLRPEIILMDIEMPRCNGIEATRQIKAELPDTSIVMLTMAEDDNHLFEAIKSGAAGYLLKGLDADTFFALLEGVTRGDVPLSPGLAARVLAAFAQPGGDASDREMHSRVRGPLATQSLPAGPGQQPGPAAAASTGGEQGLNERQVEVLTLVAQGLTYKEVGAALNLSKHTVKYHMDEILRRLHLNSRAEAIAYAARQGIATDKYRTELSTDERG